MNPTVLIVGAGPSGLAALKEMREAGIDAIAVDSRPSFGGVFALDSGVTCESLHLTISNVFMSFSDFPPYDVHKGVKYWSKSEYYEYLRQYVENFQLDTFIQLQTTVNSAHFNRPSSKWKVSVSSYSDDGKLKTDNKTFDKLIVATGVNHRPKLPKELMQFKGEILHSTNFHSGDQVRGKNILIVGTGESAVDVAECASKTANKVTMWGRRYPDFAPRFLKPYLSDASCNENEHLALHHKPNGALESITITRIVRNLPLGIWAMALHGLTTDLKNKHGANSMQGMLHAFTSRAWSSDYYSADTSLIPTKSSIPLTLSAKGLIDILISNDVKVDGKTLTFWKAQLLGSSGYQEPSNPNCQIAKTLMTLMPTSLWLALGSVSILTGSPCRTTGNH